MNDRSLAFKALEFYGCRLRHRGQWRIHGLLTNLLRANIDREIEVERAGLRWLLNPSDYVQRGLFWLGERDRWDSYHVKRLLPAGSVICDIGANFGYYSLALAEFLKRDCRVLAFEPSPETRARLERNIALNQLRDTVTVIPCALSDAPGSARMTSRKGNSGATYIRNDGETEVEVVTLDDVCARHRLSRLDFVKIDVEGFELKVLKGGERCLRAFRPILLVELMAEQLERAGTSPAEVATLLRDCGYALYVPRRKRLLPLMELPSGPQLMNVLCLPETPSKRENGGTQSKPMRQRASGAGARPSVLFAAALSPNKIGGVETFAAELARRLDKEGWDLTMCFEDSPPPSVELFLLAPGNVSLAVMRQQSGMSLSKAWEFLRLLRKNRPRVLLYTLGGVVRWWPLLGCLTGVRRRIYRDATSRTAEAYGYRASWKVRVVMSALSKSICATKYVKACSDREGIIPPEKSLVIHNAVDIARDLGDGGAFRRRYGIPGSRIVVLLVSWLVPVKGIDLALRAAKQVLCERDDVHFVFCGDGANRAEYECLADDLGIAGNATWTGMIEDLAGSGAFRAADIQIQCSQWQEAFCLAVAEGMSAGLPIIASRIGGLPELVEDGVNGLLFEPKSDIELANAILALVRDTELRSRMGAKGRERAIEDYELVQNVESWVDQLTK